MSAIELDLTSDVFPDFPARAKPLDLAAEKARIAASYAITVDEMMSRERYGCLPAARREFYVVLRARGWSYPQVARLVGRDHTTIIHALHPERHARKAARRKALGAARDDR